jgi:hypothetical protein
VVLAKNYLYELRDSCSRPPDDPSDDTPDNFPGASPYHGYNDTAEQPPDSQPVPSDYKLKTLTLITVADNLSASTSSTPAISVPALFSYNDTGVSNTSEPVSDRSSDSTSLQLIGLCRRTILSKSFSACGRALMGYLAMTGFMTAISVLTCVYFMG